MRIKSVLPWQIMPGDKIIHEIDGAVQVIFTWPDGNGGTYIQYRDRYGLPAVFRRVLLDRVLKVVDQGSPF